MRAAVETAHPDERIPLVVLGFRELRGCVGTVCGVRARWPCF